VTLSKKLWDAPGEALPDWEILSRFGTALGFSGFQYASNSAIWDEFIQLTKQRVCDMAGLTSDRLRDGNSLQWPCPQPFHYGTKRLYEELRFPTKDGKANFLARPHQDPSETTDDEFPLVLTTGRIYAHWHTLTRTGKVPKLVSRDPEPYLEISTSDAAQLQIQEGERVELRTRRGAIQLPARITPGIQSGTIFVPFHWGDLFEEGNALNYLTVADCDPISKQPELKFCAAQVCRLPKVPESALVTGSQILV
jgi:ferredoxin-nitrate reductase